MKHYHTTRMIRIILLALLATTSGCDKDEENPKIPATESLLVKFVNDSRSVVTITYISVRQMGAVQSSKLTLKSTNDNWSANILSTGSRIAPGAHQLFTLNIPSGHYAHYRLGIDKGDGTEIMMFDQPGVQDDYPTITHWGSHDRTVSATIYKNEASDTYYVAGWSDFAGITP